MLQDYLVDKDSGNLYPMVWYLCTKMKHVPFFKNWALSNWYSWRVHFHIPLDNPLHLSNVGTIQDPNGNDVIPYYYPYQENDENIPETYYVTVYSSDQNGHRAHLQFTRENFPYNPTASFPTSSSPTFRNYILNNVYWRNIGSLTTTNVTNQIIAPSQHDGFGFNGDIRFLKNVTGGADSISFLPMTTELTNDITPEFYLNYTNTGVQTGETQKCIQYPISLHVNTLQNVEASIVFHGQNVAGNANNFVDLYIYQFLGTGALSQPPPILIQRVTLNNTFQKFVIPFIFPDAEGLSLGNGGDDALFLQVQYPLSAVSSINHTKPQIYLSNTVPDNDFDTYDQIETIINSPRTSDIRTSLNQSYPFGWVALNDGTLGNSTSNATARANVDAWQLFNLLWTLFKPYDSGGINVIAQMYTSASTPQVPVTTSYGSTAISDWNANKQLALTKMMGKVLLGTVPFSALLQPTLL